MPALVAKKLWSEELRGRRVIHFLDNDSARFALIKGSSGSPWSAAILDEFWLTDAALAISSWFDRVCSASNPADPASRLEFDDELLAGARHRTADWAVGEVAAARW